MGQRPGPMEGARHRRHQDSFPSRETLLQNLDEKRAGAEGLCQPHHYTGDGTQTHERLVQRAHLDGHRLFRFSHAEHFVP